MLRADSVAHRDVEGDYHLPVFHHVPEGIRKSRNIRGGYARGWGLEFGDLRAKIAAAPLFHEAMGLAAGRTTLSEEDGMGIYQLLKFFVDRLPMGHNVEQGSFKGGDAIFMAKVSAALHLATRVCAPDTFEGIPEANAEADAHPRGNFADANYEELADYITPQDRVNLQLLGGSFEESALRWLPMIGGIRLTHIDCDIGTAAAFAFEASIAPMGPGGYLVFDDALYSSYRGATEGVRIPDPT